MSNPIASTGTVLDEKVDPNVNILEAKPLAADSSVSSHPHIPSVTASAVLGESATMPADTPQCHGHNFDKSRDIDGILDSFLTTGFQATNVGLAIERIKEMRKFRLSDREWKEGEDPALQPESIRKKIRTRIFLGYTSNQISSGQREVLRFLVQHKMVDVIVTTAGGIGRRYHQVLPTYLYGRL